MSKQKNNWISNALASGRNQTGLVASKRSNGNPAHQSDAEYFLAIDKLVAACQ